MTNNKNTCPVKLTLSINKVLNLVKQKPHLVLKSPNAIIQSAQRLQSFLNIHNVKILNVAGPRASQAPRLPHYVIAVLTQLLGLAQK